MERKRRREALISSTMKRKIPRDSSENTGKWNEYTAFVPEPAAKTNAPEPNSHLGPGNSGLSPNIIVLEDLDLFTKNKEFFLYSSEKNLGEIPSKFFQKNGAFLKLSNDRIFSNKAGVSSQQGLSGTSEGKFLNYHLEKFSKVLKTGNYHLRHKDNTHCMYADININRKKINSKEKQNISYYVKNPYEPQSITWKENDSHNRTPSAEKTRMSRKLKAIVSDTDGLQMNQLFDLHPKLSFGKIITTNTLLQNFFYCIKYWGVGDKKGLMLVNPNFESAVYGYANPEFPQSELIDYTGDSTVGYGWQLPPFFRDSPLLLEDPNVSGTEEVVETTRIETNSRLFPIRKELDSNKALQKTVLEGYSKSLSITVPDISSTFRAVQRYPKSTSYCEALFVNFYLSKKHRPTRKNNGDFSKMCIPKTTDEVEVFYKDSIQFYEIKKISESEITATLVKS